VNTCAGRGEGSSAMVGVAVEARMARGEGGVVERGWSCTSSSTRACAMILEGMRTDVDLRLMLEYAFDCKKKSEKEGKGARENR
jgi:hypothetical protein